MNPLRKALPAFLLAAMLLWAIPAAAQTGTPYDCSSSTTWTANKTLTIINTPGSHPCVAWRITFWSTAGSSLNSTLTFQTSPDNVTFTNVPNTQCGGAVQTLCWTDGANPLSGTSNGTAAIRAYAAYVRLNIVVNSGSGVGISGTVQIYGYKGTTTASASNGGGTVTSVATGCGLSGGPIVASGTIKASEAVNAQTGTTYTIADADCGKLVTFSNSASIAVTLPQANGSTFVAGWAADFQNLGVGTVTITPTTSTIDGVATLTLTTALGVRIVSDGSNYFTERGMTSLIFQAADPSGACTLGTPNIQNTTTGTQFACIAGTWGLIAAQGSGGTLIFYFTNTASDIATYKQATSSPFTPKTTLSFAGLATGTDTLQNWSTNAGFPGLTFIPQGLYNQHIHALRTGGGTVTLHTQFWEVSATGVDIAMIGQTEDSAALTGAEIQYDLEFAAANPYTLQSSASRIVARVFAVVSGSAPTVQIFVGGTADSRMGLPSNTVDATNFVPYVGATANVDLASHDILTNTGNAGFGTDARTGNVLPLTKLVVWGGNGVFADPSVLGAESLTNGALTSGTSWTVTGDFALTANAAVYTHSSGTGTLNQASGTLAIAGVMNRWYLFTYDVSAVSAGVTQCQVTTAFSDNTFGIAFDITAGTGKTFYFKTNAAPGNFIINCTSTAGGLTLDNLSLKEVQGGNAVVYGFITGGGTNGLKVFSNGSGQYSVNGALSTPAFSLTGTWITGGSATTTKPQLLIEPAGTTSTAWSTAGTGLGVNAATGFTGNLLDLQLVGVSKFHVSSAGVVTMLNLLGGTTVTFTGNSGAATLPNQFNFTSSLSGTGQQYEGFKITNTYNQPSATSVKNSDFVINRTETNLGTTPGAQLFVDFQVSAVSKFSIDNTGTPTSPVLKSTTGQRFICVDTAGKFISSATACVGT